MPEGAGSHPAVLYSHWHGGQQQAGNDELLGTNDAIQLALSS